MGADFICTFAWRPMGGPPGWDAVSRAIDAWDETDLADFLVTIDEPEDCLDEVGNIDGDKVRAEAHQILLAFRAAWEGPPRDAAKTQIGPYEVLITGGMSYGDSPTETFDLIEQAYSLPLSHAGFYKRAESEAIIDSLLGR